MKFKLKAYKWLRYAFWIAGAFVVGAVASFLFIQASTMSLAILFVPKNANSILSDSVQATSSKMGGNDAEDAVSMDVSEAALYSLKIPTTNLRVSAKAYLIGDLDNGKIIAESNGTTTYPIASVSKLMTILVAKNAEDFQDTTTISKTVVSTYGTQGELKVGEKIKVGDLEYPLLLESSNDAAEAFAEYYGLPKFINLMNQKASSIGMINTHYEDPSGLTPKNISTTEDLFKLARYIFQTTPAIFDTTRVRQYAILHHTWTNANHFLALDNFIGGKNGFTDEAQQTTVSLFNVQLGNAQGGDGGKHNIAIVLLRSQNRENDVYTILNYIRHNVQFEGATSTATSTASTTVDSSTSKK